MLLAAHSCALLVIDLQSRLVPALVEPDELLLRCRLVLQAAVRLRVPILATEQYPDGLGHLVPSIQELVTVERVVAKIAFSALRDPDPSSRIGQLDRETYVVLGAETHVCVLQTVVDLLSRGKKVAVVADGVGSRHLHDKLAGLDRMKQIGAQIVTAEMVVFEWLERAGTPAFKELIPFLRASAADIDAELAEQQWLECSMLDNMQPMLARKYHVVPILCRTFYPKLGGVDIREIGIGLTQAPDPVVLDPNQLVSR